VSNRFAEHEPRARFHGIARSAHRARSICLVALGAGSIVGAQAGVMGPMGCSRAERDGSVSAAEAPAASAAATAAATATAKPEDMEPSSAADKPAGGAGGPKARPGGGPEMSPLPEGGEGKPSELGAIALPVMKDCMRDCLQRNTVRSVGAKQIDSDCQQSCLRSCLERCDAETPGRSPQFGDVCHRECERQLSSAVQP
jgi:hypothetical protein